MSRSLRLLAVLCCALLPAAAHAQLMPPGMAPGPVRPLPVSTFRPALHVNPDGTPAAFTPAPFGAAAQGVTNHRPGSFRDQNLDGIPDAWQLLGFADRNHDGIADSFQRPFGIGPFIPQRMPGKGR
jgi:hypothetical protein